MRTSNQSRIPYKQPMNRQFFPKVNLVKLPVLCRKTSGRGCFVRRTDCGLARIFDGQFGASNVNCPANGRFFRGVRNGDFEMKSQKEPPGP